MPRVFITGANRGIGLEFVRQYLEAGWTVHAACRTPGAASKLTELQTNAALCAHKMDVTDQSDIDRVACALADTPIDLLINNAGIAEYSGSPDPGQETGLRNYDFEFWERCLNVNLLGPARVTAALLPLLKAGTCKKVIMISSGLASISERHMPGLYAYRSSKAALNMLTTGLAREFESAGITTVSLAPGWTKTDMGGPHAKLSVDTVVSSMVRVIGDLTKQDSGKFLRWNGEPVAW